MRQKRDGGGTGELSVEGPAYWNWQVRAVKGRQAGKQACRRINTEVGEREVER